MTLVLATRNAGKVAELIRLLEPLAIEVRSLDAFPGVPEVEESFDTLEENARLKAASVHHRTGLPSLADDTGLEVTTLSGRPGVHSARYAGPEADARRNREKLLKALEGKRDRSAQFRTVIVLADGAGEHYFEGVCAGTIAEAERGSGGFGYDSIFIPNGHSRTFAELTPSEKNEISHRGVAVRKLVAHLSKTREDAT